MSKTFALVGTGIKTVSHMTAEAQSLISNADKVYFLLNEPVAQDYITELATGEVESLDKIYFSYQDRADAYKAISSEIIQAVDIYQNTCFVIYGHPCFYAKSGLDAIKKIELKKGVRVIVAPGISSEDCLYADLRIDPAVNGCMKLDATAILFRGKKILPDLDVIIFQIGMLGNKGLPTKEVDRDLMGELKDVLVKYYDNDKKLILYEASLYPNIKPSIKYIVLSDLASHDFSPLTTLYIPAN
jgi:uncharacterized protein YabN with tetrapyrrole methylase and pyrophosphatase domain